MIRKVLVIMTTVLAPITSPGQPMLPFHVTSPDFEHNGPIPSRHTCDGANISPALRWTDVPPETKSLALIVDDPDAPDPRAPRMRWVHWVLYNLPPDVKSLPENAGKNLPAGVLAGMNDAHHTGYDGPYPPTGRHRYYFKLYALDMVLPDLQLPTKARLESAMKGHIISEALLIGTYRRL